MLTGDGRIVTASRTNEHADLFRAFPNSYGTLGYALRLRIELERVHPYVTLTHHRFDELRNRKHDIGERQRTRVVGVDSVPR